MTDPFKNKVDDLKKVLQGKKKETEPEEPPAETPPELVDLQEKLNLAEEEAKQNYDKLLRVVAEFDNYKKRVARDHEDRAKYNLESLLKELIPVLDDFDRVLEHLPKVTNPEIKSLIEGVELTHRHFTTALKKLHLTEVTTKHKMFDPHFHEALNQVESEEHKEGEIVSCHRKGYLLHERLLRPALVTVAKEKGNNAN